VVDRELTEEDGETTPTMEVERDVVYDHYRDELERCTSTSLGS